MMKMGTLKTHHIQSIENTTEEPSGVPFFSNELLKKELKEISFEPKISKIHTNGGGK